MTRRLLHAALVASAMILNACVESNEDTPTPADEPSPFPGGGGGGGQGTVDSGGQQPADDTSVVRGTWMLELTTDTRPASMGASFRMLSEDGITLAPDNVSRGTTQQPINGIVPENVSFTVSSTGFLAPTITNGVVSYGTLNVTALRDNSLRICGTGRNQRCTTGIVRIYSTGTTGPGLWSEVEGYGLPITSGTSTVGLGAANAAVAGTHTIAASRRVLTLSQFTTTGSLAIPISVDFTDAAAGTYSTTLVVEYALQ